MGLHLLRWERGKHSGNVRRPGTESRVQPLLSLQRVKDHRHTVMNAAQQGIGHGGYDRKAVEHLAVDISPHIPKPCCKNQTFQALRVALVGGSWGLLFIVYGQKTENHLKAASTRTGA